MMSNLAVSEIAIGDKVTALNRKVTQEQVNAYADASGDHNPIHVDPDFARMVGLPGTIAHGLLEMAILTETVARWVGSYESVSGISCRFSKPLLPGQTITCSGQVVAIEGDTATLELAAVSDSGERVLTNGRATVRLHS